MISHEYRCIFIHQRKCAGTSIMRSFGVESGTPEWNFANEGVLGKDRAQWPAGYVVVSAVRNPWDRFVSGWKYLKATRDLSLRDLLSSLPESGHDYRHLVRPQSAIRVNSDGTPVWDHLLRIETLQDDYDRLSDRIGKPRTPLPLAKKGERDDYRRYYDVDTAERVGSLFREDIERFGYAFDR